MGGRLQVRNPFLEEGHKGLIQSWLFAGIAGLPSLLFREILIHS
jgi:hypothetical protein